MCGGSSSFYKHTYIEIDKQNLEKMFENVDKNTQY